MTPKLGKSVRLTSKTSNFVKLDDNVDIDMSWESTRISKFQTKKSLVHFKLKQHKAWFGVEFSKLSGKRKQDKLL
jgi:hypothetical protein